MFGGGKMVVLCVLEDFEFYCVDNLLVSLLLCLVNVVLEDCGGQCMMCIVVGVDVCNCEYDIEIMFSVFFELVVVGVQVYLIFFDCCDEVLIKCYLEICWCYLLVMCNVLLVDVIVVEW